MTPARYRKLAYGSGRLGGIALIRPEEALDDCERCHADDGRGQPDIPVLAGQKRTYLLATLKAYAAGTRTSAVMGSVAARLDADTMSAMANHYAGLPARLTSLDVNPSLDVNKGSVSQPVASGSTEVSRAREDVARARQIVEHGLPEVNLPACIRCHGEGKSAHYPLVGAQKAQYLAARLRRWRGDPNVSDARKPNESMPMIARRIPEDMIEPLARYFERASAERVGGRTREEGPNARSPGEPGSR
jgi:cytochrome c553